MERFYNCLVKTTGGYPDLPLAEALFVLYAHVDETRGVC